MSPDDSTRELLRKLLSLAADPVATENEQQVARGKAEEIALKYGIELDDLEETDKDPWVAHYRYKTIHEKKVLVQIFGTVLNKTSFYTYRNLRHRLGVEATDSQHMRIQMLYSRYRSELRKEIERTTKAFIMANGIYPEVSGSEHHDLTPEEIAEILKILKRAERMDKIHIDPQLEGGG